LWGYGLCEFEFIDDKINFDSTIKERRIWAEDAAHLLKIQDIFKVTEAELETIFNDLQPLLEAARQERKKNYKPPTYNHLSIPLVRRKYPEL
jgi:argininosuccinate lyase